MSPPVGSLYSARDSRDLGPFCPIQRQQKSTLQLILANADDRKGIDMKEMLISEVAKHKGVSRQAVYDNLDLLTVREAAGRKVVVQDDRLEAWTPNTSKLQRRMAVLEKQIQSLSGKGVQDEAAGADSGITRRYLDEQFDNFKEELKAKEQEYSILKSQMQGLTTEVSVLGEQLKILILMTLGQETGKQPECYGKFDGDALLCAICPHRTPCRTNEER